MGNEMIKNSAEFISASIESLKHITESNIATAKSWFVAPYGVGEWAAFGKNSLSLANGWGEINNRVLDEWLQSQLNTFSVDAYVPALKELSAITASAMESLYRSQVETMNAYLDELGKFSGNLKKVKGVDDLLTAQVGLLTALQQQAKDGALASFEILNSTKNGITAWTEKSLDQAGAEEPPRKNKKWPDPQRP